VKSIKSDSDQQKTQVLNPGRQFFRRKNKGGTAELIDRQTLMTKKLNNVVSQFLKEKIGVTPSVAAQGDTNPSDATAFETLDISQGSVATHLRCGGIFSDCIITNCLLILTVK